MRRPTRATDAVLTVPLLLAFACAGERGDGDSAGLGGDDGSGADDGATGSGTHETTDWPGGLPKFDVGHGGGGGVGDGEEGGCPAIDFLFVIDNSKSMSGEQQNLISSFPGFITTVQQVTGAEDFHILVADSDDYCKGWPCPAGPFTSCDQIIGAGKVLDQNEAPCGVEAPHRYMLATQPDLVGTFACVAEVGTQGHPDERPMDSVVAALSSDLNGSGGCNEGFVRDEAVLVVVVITDEEDDDEAVTGEFCNDDVFAGSAGEPDAWYDAVVAAKGVETNVVVLSLVGPVTPACTGKAGCSGETGAEIAHRIVDFTERFTFGSIGQVCASSYDEFFRDAVGTIDDACDVYEPPG